MSSFMIDKKKLETDSTNAWSYSSVGVNQILLRLVYIYIQIYIYIKYICPELKKHIIKLVIDVIVIVFKSIG